MESFIGAYQAQYGQVPPTKAELARALGEAHHPLASLGDPWGNPYEYQASSAKTFFLWSTGGSADPELFIGRFP